MPPQSSSLSHQSQQVSSGVQPATTAATLRVPTQVEPTAYPAKKLAMQSRLTHSFSEEDEKDEYDEIIDEMMESDECVIPDMEATDDHSDDNNSYRSGNMSLYLAYSARGGIGDQSSVSTRSLHHLQTEAAPSGAAVHYRGNLLVNSGNDEDSKEEDVDPRASFERLSRLLSSVKLEPSLMSDAMGIRVQSYLQKTATTTTTAAARNNITSVVSEEEQVALPPIGEKTSDEKIAPAPPEQAPPRSRVPRFRFEETTPLPRKPMLPRSKSWRETTNTKKRSLGLEDIVDSDDASSGEFTFSDFSVASSLRMDDPIFLAQVERSEPEPAEKEAKGGGIRRRLFALARKTSAKNDDRFVPPRFIEIEKINASTSRRSGRTKASPPYSHFNSNEGLIEL